MTLTPEEQLGRIISKSIADTEAIKEDTIPDDIIQSVLLNPFDSVIINTSIVVKKKYHASDSFIIDHPVQGELDNSTLKLDGSYKQAKYGFTFPVTFPATFELLELGEEVIYTYND